MTHQPGVPAERPSSLQAQVEEQAVHRKYGTFAGVFTPTILTILGVIMYLRQGSVVGNAGLLGAILIILLVVGITACTGLSLSSVTTNIRIGAGGAYSIISQSLGLEVGGSVGIPLFLSQALAVTMYVFGFREGWQFLFPDHPALLVDLAVFALLMGIALVSAGLAFRIQYVIMAVIGLSLVSIFATVFTGGLQYEPQLWGDYPGFPEDGFQGTSFWFVFALFFPAATGIMAGANMSGELANPKRSIPVGTMSAIALGAAIYLALAWWLARVASPDELVTNYTIMIDRALWPPAVLAGLLGATFSSGLASLVGAPRILHALGEGGILPGGEALARRTRRGEPRNAVLLTGAIVFAALFFRDLNTVAPLITMFFLITYGMINLVVLTEQSLGLVSFRPLLRIPRAIPFLGAAGCLFAMFIIEPVFGLVAVGLVVMFYALLLRRRLVAPEGDVRSGLFAALAEWSAKKVAELPPSRERAWQPNILVPVERMTELRGAFPLLCDLAAIRGSVKLLGLTGGADGERVRERLPALARAFREKGVFSQLTLIDDTSPGEGLLAGMQALDGAFFRPNILFLRLPRAGDTSREQEVLAVVRKARRKRIGVLMFAEHPEAYLGRRHHINVWIAEQGPAWELSARLGNLDLALLTGYILKESWRGRMHALTVVGGADPDEARRARKFLENLMELARMPDAVVLVRTGTLMEQMPLLPAADLNIFGLAPEPDFEAARRLVRETRSACLFVQDSEEESVLA